MPITQNLIRNFFLRETLKGNGKGGSGIERVHIVGAGNMGAQIGAWCAFKGMHVTIEDPEPQSLGRAVAGMHRLADRKLHDPEALRAKDRFIPDPHGDGLRQADLVIEAAPENVSLKGAIYARLESEARRDAIIATNTSSLDIAELTSGLARPGRFVGIHFFNPVSRLDLIEVVCHDGVDETTHTRALRFVADIGKLPLPVKAAPGFLVNRALMPYLGEALLMIDEREQPERIDAAAEAFGMPVGPVELADQVGLDICLAVAESLAENLDRPMPRIPEWLRAKVANGEFGRKTGQGLYAYDADGKPKKDKLRHDPDEAMQDRLILPMVDAVAAALEEGVVADADSADAAMIFGTGFAPFRGGPMHYAQERGRGNVLATLDKLAAVHGARFEPSRWWRQKAEA
nr:3-hydroxyacyl-CoA dehydrogenase family protein [Novosphingobium profundi]